MALPRASASCLALGAALALLAQPAAEVRAQTGNARLIYCCDVGGQPVCGDILPAACYGRSYRELSASGVVKRVVPAPLTSEEIARRNELELKRRNEEVDRLRKQRQDQALLETYRSLADLDSRRDRELGDLDRVLSELRERENTLIGQQSVLIREASRTDKSEVANSIELNIRVLDSEIESQRRVIDAKLRDRAAVVERFNEDRRRYLELTRAQNTPAQNGTASPR